jgi:hypothetical protein
MLTLFWDHRGPLVEHWHVQGDHSHQCHILWLPYESFETSNQIKTSCIMATLGPILSVLQLQLSRTCVSSASLILHTHLTSTLLTSISLGHWRRRLVERLSAPMKKCKRHCMSGCARGQGNPGISETPEDMHWTQRGLCWKMTKPYRTYVQYTSCEKHFKVFIWLALAF